MKFLDYVYNYTLTGPSGTGKTTFKAYYLQEHYNEYQNPGYWVTFPSIEPKIRRLLPDFIETTTDLFDPRFTDPRDGFPRTFVAVDEFNRLLKKQKHYTDDANLLVDLISIHRHKNFDFIISDQAFDFLKGVRERTHWIGFTGISPMIYSSLKANLSKRMMYWIDDNITDIIDLGMNNRETLEKEGYGTVILTDGSSSYAIDFERPSWYTRELSEIWKYVTMQDLRKDNQSEDQFEEFDLNSEMYKTLLLSYHVANNIFGGTLTKEKLSAAFMRSSAALTGNALKLPSNGRGYPELIKINHSLDCYWCNNQEDYRQILNEIISNSKENKNKMDKKTKAVEKELKQHLG